MTIVKGPSKHELFAAFSYGGGTKRLTIDFTLDDGLTITCTVNSIEWEDGSGHCWNIKGWSPNLTSPGGRFRAFYRTNTGRTQGTLTPDSSF